MVKTITTKKFTKNIVFSITAQIISMLVSFLLNLIVPRFIDEYQYAYWQTYVLYVGYVGVLHFGLLDGLVLRYSKYDYEELDKQRIRSQFLILLVFTTILSLVTVTVSLAMLGATDMWIFIFVAIGIVLKNAVTYGSYLFQITNRISKYVTMIILQRLTYGLIVIVLLVCRINSFQWLCVAEVCGDIVGLVIGIAYNRGLFFGKPVAIGEAFREMRMNVGSGIILMMANWSSMLLVGSAKMITQWHWGELLFGKVSFAFSVSNVFLSFVTAISVVMFPSLNRIDQSKLPEMYKGIRNLLSPLLYFVMIFYFVGCWILDLWLPKYSSSLPYLGILLPIIIYSSKVSLLTNNYMKVYRKEKRMLIVNLISISVGVALFLICAYSFNNIYAMLGSVVFVIMLNSILAEICVLRIIHAKIIKEFIIETLMTIAFILCASLLSRWVGCLVYFGIFAVYAAVNYKAIVSIVKQIKGRKQVKEENEN